MTEHPDGVHHTTQEERDRAMAVHSVDDETRVHGEPDETEQVMGADGDLRVPDPEDAGEGVIVPETDGDTPPE
ncbi:hypothetical protein E1262_19045 [Jiangella aurantiaca]|uniref:Uncharacterized protein n=1 Tax=Jiangella aurantiaca TaxID=2530373 RepID=A0A4V2YRR7_9ACTN|nr:hypothetical protein [Jiangella aurantiaca]TDD67377.1 hypothetical protein E1262_19045 [Jiangella aurantiaca]